MLPNPGRLGPNRDLVVVPIAVSTCGRTLPYMDGRQRILVVDDDATVADVVERYLCREGYEVETVGDGRVALDRALADPPDLVVLDLVLPRMDGLGLPPPAGARSGAGDHAHCAWRRVRSGGRS